MIETIKQQIKLLISSELNINASVEMPKKQEYDLSIPLFGIAKEKKISIMDVFLMMEPVLLKIELIQNVVFVQGFLNIILNKPAYSKWVLNKIYHEKQTFGNVQYDKQPVVVIDYSSPNIAKSFSVGHLRSTVIGNALKLIYQKLGYQAIGINHLGDWGTQFGKMIVAYQKWGNEQDLKANAIQTLQALYVRFHKEAETNPNLEQEGRDAFLQLELGNQTYIALWQWFKDISLKEFMDMYDKLGVSFDYYDGESFYNDKMEAVVTELEQKALLEIDQGASIVRLNDFPPALIKRTDGATLYITRDLAALFYRYRHYHFNKALYVVGNEQRLHFNQLRAVSQKMGYDFDIEHVNFGLVLYEGKKMSTREGKFKNLDDVLTQAIQLAKTSIKEKNPHLESIDEIAKAIGVGAIIYNDLRNERHLDIDFNLESMLKFEGQTGPYIQYSGVRIHSILKEAVINIDHVDYQYYSESYYFDLVLLLSQFPSMLHKAKESNMPSVIAKYVYQLAQSFNHFYGRQKIMVEDERHKQANLLLIYDVLEVLKEGLRLLGIQYLEQM